SLRVDPVQVAAIAPKTASSQPRKRAEQAFGVAAQPMPDVAALGAIEALSGGQEIRDVRDPSLPYPLSVPTKLAYARDNAPDLKDFTPTLTQASMDATKKQHWCMATAIYFEARGESYRGQVAVAQVVRNRVKHKAYPNSICSVVFQNQSWKNRCQFSFACDGVPERVNEQAAWKQAEEIATKVIQGDIYLPNVANATHYHANYVHPKWAPKLKKLTQVGVHIFYRFKKG
ncbi:cell wall hydrolase, partial [uncultured Maritalea sp.]|uniref:cell wall hydrolase n=1 Tax=uncultured Maritalea sp. TaxID=757249 RepID=UPI0026361EE1